jgi:hypothetical protein
MGTATQRTVARSARHAEALPWKDVIIDEHDDHPPPSRLRDHQKIISAMMWSAVRDSASVHHLSERTLEKDYRRRMKEKDEARKWLLSEAKQYWHNMDATVTYETFIAGLQAKWKWIGNSKNRSRKFLSDLGRLEGV